MRYIITALLFLLCAPTVQAGVFVGFGVAGGGSGLVGLDSIASAYDTGVPANNTIILSRVQATTSGEVDNFTTYIAGGGNWIGVIYSDNAGEPGSLLAQTASTPVGDYSSHYVSSALLSAITVSSASNYWVGAQFSNVSYLFYESTQTQVTKMYVTTFGSPPVEWPTESDTEGSDLTGIGVWYAN